MKTNLITETDFNKFVTNKAEKFDIIYITTNSNNNLQFKIISNDQGQLTLTNLRQNPMLIYFMTQNSLHGDTLELLKVKKDAPKDILNDKKKWQTETIGNIKDIMLLRDNNIISYISTKEKKHNYFEDEADNILGIIAEQLEKNKSLSITLSNKTTISFCCLAVSNYSYTLELNESNNLGKLSEFNSFLFKMNYDNEIDVNDTTNKLYKKNKNIIKTNDSGKTFSLLFTANIGQINKRIWINNIVGVSIDENCPITNNDEPEETVNNIDSDNEAKEQGKIAYDMILSDPTLKNAFYSQPSFWKLFVAELTGKSAVGDGIYTALDLVKQYDTKKIKQSLGGDFISNKRISFKSINDINIPYVRNGKEHTYEFDPNSNIDYEPIVLEREIGDNVKVRGKLESYLGYIIEILDSVENKPDTFKCKITLFVIKESRVTRYPYNNDFIIKIDRDKSPGYRPN